MLCSIITKNETPESLKTQTESELQNNLKFLTYLQHKNRRCGHRNKFSCDKDLTYSLTIIYFL